MSDPQLAELLDAIVADPDDLELRLIYADACAERGDPRGEFITLQCEAQPTEVQRKRMRVLQRIHGMSWTAGLHPLIADGETRFRGGFLFSVSLWRRAEWQYAQLKLTEEVRLVQRLRFARRYVDVEERPLTPLLPHFTGVDTVRGATLQEVRALSTSGAALTQVELDRVDLPLATLLDRLDLPDLVSLGLHADDHTRPLALFLLRHPAIRAVQVGMGDPVAWRRALEERVTELTVKIPGWSLVFANQGLERLDVWKVGGHGERAVDDLTAVIDRFDVGEIGFIHVRTGRPPDPDGLQRLRRAAKGSPLLLPALWRRRL